MTRPTRDSRRLPKLQSKLQIQLAFGGVGLIAVCALLLLFLDGAPRSAAVTGGEALLFLCFVYAAVRRQKRRP
jgi:hypothetical protein